MNKIRIQRLLVIFVIFIMCLNFLFPVKAQKVSDEFKGEMVCKDKNIWTDDMWQFYEIQVKIGQRVYVRLQYKGDLDLDLRLYWKRDNGQDFKGFDLTHCDINSENYKYSDNSQLRTHNTYDLGIPEEIEIY
ncbi:MAG: hypothetical protein ACP6IY_22060, partial [Promethearchaeia archaeon]